MKKRKQATVADENGGIAKKPKIETVKFALGEDNTDDTCDFGANAIDMKPKTTTTRTEETKTKLKPQSSNRKTKKQSKPAAAPSIVDKVTPPPQQATTPMDDDIDLSLFMTPSSQQQTNSDSPSLLFADKYRPKTLADIVGHEDQRISVCNFLKSRLTEPYGKSFQMILISGPNGCGKDELARRALESRGYKIIEFGGSDGSFDTAKNVKSVGPDINTVYQACLLYTSDAADE